MTHLNFHITYASLVLLCSRIGNLLSNEEIVFHPTPPEASANMDLNLKFMNSFSTRFVSNHPHSRTTLFKLSTAF